MHTWRASFSLSSPSAAARACRSLPWTLHSPTTRCAETFEATLRALDEHPEYVDELFVATLSHPVTLDQPKGLKRTIVAVLDEASDDPAALKAASEAMAERAQVSAMVVVESDASIRANLRALLQKALKNPRARRSLLVAVSENADSMARLLAPMPPPPVPLPAFALPPEPPLLVPVPAVPVPVPAVPVPVPAPLLVPALLAPAPPVPPSSPPSSHPALSCPRQISPSTKRDFHGFRMATPSAVRVPRFQATTH
ncbi:MAG: hypothetical protein K0R38_6843 [Polyangiaceae bacterium]|nr:hypothetical protein [Polyangiaceae bacterium]